MFYFFACPCVGLSIIVNAISIEKHCPPSIMHASIMHGANAKNTTALINITDGEKHTLGSSFPTCRERITKNVCNSSVGASFTYSDE